MKKIAQFISEIDQILGLSKEAFIPASAVNGTQDQSGQLMQQIQQQAQSAPPEIQQQIQQAMQQIQSLPPGEQAQALQQIAQGLQQQGQTGSGAQGAPGQQGAGQSPQPKDQQIDPNSVLQSDNNLDTTMVQMSVRELMDLTSGGKATQAKVKVKQLVDAHNQKMQQSQQQMEMQQQQAAAQQQAGMQGGGIYPVGPDGAQAGGGMGAAQPPTGNGIAKSPM